MSLCQRAVNETQSPSVFLVPSKGRLGRYRVVPGAEPIRRNSDSPNSMLVSSCPVPDPDSRRSLLWVPPIPPLFFVSQRVVDLTFHEPLYSRLTRRRVKTAYLSFFFGRR